MKVTTYHLISLIISHIISNSFHPISKLSSYIYIYIDISIFILDCWYIINPLNVTIDRYDVITSQANPIPAQFQPTSIGLDCDTASIGELAFNLSYSDYIRNTFELEDPW